MVSIQHANVPGTVAWPELGTPDLEASKAFYRRLFGWESYTLTLGPLGDYEIFTLGPQGTEVAGMVQLADDTARPSWTCYFRSDDVEGSARAVRNAGGRETLEPVRVAHLGWSGLFVDSLGADFAVWGPGEVPDTFLTGKPSTLCWVELACRDIEEARRFYGEVFGWRAEDRDYYSSVYTVWWLGDRPVAGMVHMDEHWPPSYPPHWVPYFAVADCDASVALAAELGARIHVPPYDLPTGRFSIMTDPVGTRLAVIDPTGVV